MKPRKLKIKGLNSFIDSQEIDFERLTEKGLFGIFGPTGSGKSTILDAITIALYGRIARDSDEFINTECNDLSITYEFEIGQGSERKKYVADRNVKRDKNGRYKTSLARLLDVNGGVILAEATRDVQTEVEKIVGLTCDDFTRSVVLPQGKFSEFLKLTGKERRDMLERIFGLEKYGKNLLDKIRKERNSKLKAMDLLTGELKGFKDISEEVYEESKNQLDILLEEEKILKNKKEILDGQYEKFKVTWELQKELEEYKNLKIILDNQKKDVEDKTEKVKKAHNALIVKPYIDSLKNTEEKINKNQEELAKLRKIVENVAEKLNLTEKDYNCIVLRKDKEIPELVTKEANLNQSIELLNKTEKLEEEKADLLAIYYKKQDEQQKLKNELEKINKERLLLQKNIEDTINRLNSIRVEPEYRDKVQAASYKEAEYYDLEAKLKELSGKREDKKKSIINLKKHYKEITLEHEKIDNEFLIIQKEKHELENNFPGDNSILLEKQNLLMQTSKVLDEALRNIEERDKLNDKLKPVLQFKVKLEQNLALVNDNIMTLQSSIELMQKEIEISERANLAFILAEKIQEQEPCPVCGSVHHPKLAEQVKAEGLEDKKQLLENLKIKFDKLQSEMREINMKLVALEKDKQFIEEELEKINEKLVIIDINEIKNRRSVLEYEFTELKRNIEQWNSRKTANDKNLLDIKDFKTNIEKDLIKLSETVKGEEVALAEVDNTFNELSEQLKNSKEEYLNLKVELKIENIEVKLQELKNYEKEALTLQRDEKNLRSSLESVEERREEFNKLIGNYEVEIAKILEIGKEKKAVVDDYKKEIGRLSEGKEPRKNIEVIREAIAEIKSLEANLKTKLDNIKNEKQQLENKSLSLEEGNNALSKVLIEQEEQLIKSLTDNRFTSREEALNCLLPKEYISNLESFIKDYEDKLKNTENNILRIEKRLAGDLIEEEMWNNLQLERIENNNRLDIKLQEIAKCQQSIEKLKKELEELKELLKQKKELEHIQSLLDDLDKLVQGNRFVEFVAMNQLKYIALEASKRLKDITRGRYALELDSNGNFTMRDDFNGGVIRPTSTLSGGETFLTSLALALSLSSQIQLKGSAPLEFFFLDEGFGTLDTDLLEIVISSLERLHSDRLSVGIISHVEELKNRVPVKLIVEPALPGQGGSKVKIEYT
ncbi:RecF/RecN/SMC protein [Clostridiales bacterium oral taxon 876 str. F0540]|nr:RecF/RecN/SMC protein [Clostridiales bacterium oral taxon 876 str. F0540]